MTIFVPETVAQRWVRSQLIGSAAVLAALGNSNIYPNISPPDVTGRHVTHGFYGPSGGRRPTPLGRAVVQVGMMWKITAWEPSYSQQALEPLMAAIMVALAGPTGRGVTVRYTDGAQLYAIDCEWAGPEIVAVEAVLAGLWAPLCHLYEITVRPVA